MARALRYKCIGYGCMVLFFYILQSAADSPARVMGQMPSFMLLLTIAVSFRESEVFSAYFGLICGFLSDAVTGSTVGFRAVLYMFLGFFLAIALQTLFRPLFLSYVCVTLTVLTASVMLDYLFFILLDGSIAFTEALLRIMLPQILLSGVWSYIVYYVVYRYNLTLKRKGIIS
ncbi:MAG: rod shape-determining protein MreD [Clostridia bacterium]|nr:rod shape-determining protein MreD [Clostridia bacterium]